MKIFIFAAFLLTSSVYSAGTGRNPMGPPTMGQPSYPNSGPLRNRSDDVTGSGMSNSTLQGSDVDPRVPNRNPQVKQEQKEKQEVGPYKNGKYQFWDPSEDQKK